MLFSIKSTALSILLVSATAFAATAADAEPADVTLVERGSWDATVFSGPNCNQGAATAVHGEGGGCHHPGGQSINVALKGGCKWKSYSGTNCAGSQIDLSGGCNKVTFGSWLVQC